MMTQPRQRKCDTCAKLLLSNTILVCKEYLLMKAIILSAAQKFSCCNSNRLVITKTSISDACIHCCGGLLDYMQQHCIQECSVIYFYSWLYSEFPLSIYVINMDIKQCWRYALVHSLINVNLLCQIFDYRQYNLV